MADLTNNSSDLADLVTSALQSSRSLHLTVKGLPSQSPIPELIEQLKTFDTALQKLAQMLTTRSAEFTALELPLRNCGTRCEELKEQISQYRDLDILGFIRTLKVYTSTIVIKMIDVAFSAGDVMFTTESLEEYNELIRDTQSGLEQYMEEMESKLHQMDKMKQ